MKELEPIQKHTLNLFEGDFDSLQRMFPQVGASAVIRQLVRRYIKEKASNTTENLPEIKVNL